MSAENALHYVEIIHWAALGIMMVVYIVRLFWMFSFKNASDRSKPGLQGNTTLEPALYSLGNVLMPWAMESTRTKIPFYVTFVLFHLGVVAGISLAFVSSIYREFMEIPAVSYLFMTILALAFLVAVGRVIRRFSKPYLRLISSPDDYFSVFLMTVWFGLGVLAQAHIAGLLESVWFLVVFLAVTSFFLIYVPFSKISHYLYYPFTRYWIGKALGHRGSLRPSKG